VSRFLGYCGGYKYKNVMITESPMTSNRVLRIATRASRLALWQAAHVQLLLREYLNESVELLSLTTLGDQILDRSLSKVGGKGLFVKELEAALFEGRAHIAVHSLKDLPMDLPFGCSLVAVLEREDPRDAFVSSKYASLHALPLGAKVGTSSLRRMVQLHALRPDLRIEPLRGNLDTRLQKLDGGGFDAIVLACAGLIRLGLSHRIRNQFPIDQMIPCAGQGALGLEALSHQLLLQAQLSELTHRPTWLAVHAERAVSRSLGGSCSVPLAAYAFWDGDILQLTAALGHGSQISQPILRANTQAHVVTDAQAQAMGEQVAQSLRSQGAAAYLQV
jgi:hydroxymethylbilane synthase